MHNSAMLTTVDELRTVVYVRGIVVPFGIAAMCPGRDDPFQQGEILRRAVCLSLQRILPRHNHLE